MAVIIKYEIDGLSAISLIYRLSVCHLLPLADCFLNFLLFKENFTLFLADALVNP